MDNTVTETRTEVTTVTEEITIERKQPKIIEKDVELVECAICDTLEQKVIPITVGFREPPLNDDAAHAVVCEYCAIHVLDLGRANLEYLDVEEMNHRGKRFHDVRDAQHRAVYVLGASALFGWAVATLVPPIGNITVMGTVIGILVMSGILISLYPRGDSVSTIVPEQRKSE